MKKLGVRFDTEKVNSDLGRIGKHTGKSKSEVARTAMQIGLDCLDGYLLNRREIAIQLIEEFK